MLPSTAHHHAAAVASRTVTRATVSAIGTTASQGAMLYLALERTDASRLRLELAERLATRGLALANEGPGWLRIVKRITSVRELPVGDACQVARCGGRIRFGRCTRCSTRQESAL